MRSGPPCCWMIVSETCTCVVLKAKRFLQCICCLTLCQGRSVVSTIMQILVIVACGTDVAVRIAVEL